MKTKEKILKEAVVVYLVNKDNNDNITDVWLSIKTRKIGAGCRNGYGGGIEEETEKRAGIRETREETRGVKILARFMEKVATVYCHNKLENGESFICAVHMYISDYYSQKPRSSYKHGMINPVLYNVKDLPIDELMPADRDWLPHVLAGKKLVAHAYYNPRQESLYQPTEIEFVDKI